MFTNSVVLRMSVKVAYYSHYLLVIGKTIFGFKFICHLEEKNFTVHSIILRQWCGGCKETVGLRLSVAAASLRFIKI